MRSLDIRDARTVTQLLIGHGVLDYYMHKLNRNNMPDCRRCMEEEEISLYVLGQCPAYAGLKFRMLDFNFLEPEQIDRLSVSDLLFFWNGTGLIGDFRENTMALDLCALSDPFWLPHPFLMLFLLLPSKSYKFSNYSV